MNINAMSAMLMMLTCTFAAAQPKAYSFADVQFRNHNQQWQQFLIPDEDCVAYFDESEIALNIDQIYHLTIKSTSHLPNGGVIYLCKDRQNKEMTITLIGNDRMFVYNNEKRFQVNFVRSEIAQARTQLPKPSQSVNISVATTAE